jgi:hypothetical protein
LLRRFNDPNKDWSPIWENTNDFVTVSVKSIQKNSSILIAGVKADRPALHHVRAHEKAVPYNFSASSGSTPKRL